LQVVLVKRKKLQVDLQFPQLDLGANELLLRSRHA
jgi:hypothetical protein